MAGTAVWLRTQLLPLIWTLKIRWTCLWSVMGQRTMTDFEATLGTLGLVPIFQFLGKISLQIAPYSNCFFDASLWGISWKPLCTHVKAVRASKGRMCCPSLSSSKHASPWQASASWWWLVICSISNSTIHTNVGNSIASINIRDLSWFTILDLILD